MPSPLYAHTWECPGPRGCGVCGACKADQWTQANPPEVNASGALNIRFAPEPERTA